MLFWELVSAFRERRDLLHEVLHRPEWSETYGAWLDRFDDLARRQDRSILDAPVPVELSRAVARGDERLWSLDDGGWLRRAKGPPLPAQRELTTVEVHDAFGGAVIEEVEERGPFNVRGER
jgi:hypothetical protein